MSELREAGFELDGLRFGSDEDDVVVHGFDPGTRAVRNGDLVSGNTLVPGVDRLDPPLWTFEMDTNRDSAAGAIDSAGRLSAAWHDPNKMSSAGDVSVLRYRLGGRIRRAYGRPRRWRTLEISELLWVGWQSAIADFQLADPHVYDDELHTQEVSILPPTSGGLVTPLVTPLTTSANGPREGTIPMVATETPTPAIITINGPVTNPRVTGWGWMVQLDTQIPYGMSVTIDSHPWAMTATRNDGRSMNWALSRWTRMSRVRLQPGSNDITFEGIDGTGTSSCQIGWRGAYTNL